MQSFDSLHFWGLILPPNLLLMCQQYLEFLFHLASKVWAGLELLCLQDETQPCVLSPEQILWIKHATCFQRHCLPHYRFPVPLFTGVVTRLSSAQRMCLAVPFQQPFLWAPNRNLLKTPFKFTAMATRANHSHSSPLPSASSHPHCWPRQEQSHSPH